MEEQDYQDEAARLAQMPREEQAAVIAWLKDIASNPKLKKADREAAHERAKTLERLLFPVRNKKHKP